MMIKYTIIRRVGGLIFILALLFVSPVVLAQKGKYMAVDEDLLIRRDPKSLLRKYLFVDKSLFTSEFDVSTVITLLNKKRFLASKYNLTESEKAYLLGCSYLIKGQYKVALERLGKLKDSDFNYQVLLLRASCWRELKKPFYSADVYQVVYDSANSMAAKEIVKLHHRYNQYGF